MENLESATYVYLRSERKRDQMKIISPKYEIIEDALSQMTIEQRIELCGRVCYKSEDKIKKESANKFSVDVMTNGHNSVLEMADLHISQDVVDWQDDFAAEAMQQMKYLQISPIDSPEGGYVISGSIRAFRECASLLPFAVIFFCQS